MVCGGHALSAQRGHHVTRGARRPAAHGFRLIIERSPDLVIVQRGDRIIYANPAAAARLGHPSAASLAGQPLSAIVIEQGPPRADAGSHLTERWRCLDGTAIMVEVVRDEVAFEGEPAVVLIARDMTERNNITATMIETDRMATIGILAAGVGHEINNPLAYVLANLEFVTGELDGLLAEIPPAASERLAPRIADLRQALTDTTHGAERVRDIVQDLRMFSRGDDEKVTFVDVRQVLDSSLRMAAVQMRQRATIVKEYGEVPLVVANESRLGQVFLNVVVNAAQALPDRPSGGNRITLRTREEKRDVIVEIADTGAGIPADVLPRIFEPFFTTKAAGHGTGLGLSICRKIIRTLGGDITVTSVPGEGTTFAMKLPRATADSTVPVSGAPPGGTARRGRVLCVDDEPSVGLALKRVLGDAHDVVVLTGAAAARDRIAAGERFDVILCDLMMPEMTGMDLHGEILGLAPDQARRMIFLSGGAFTGPARDFLAGVENPRLAKPVSVEDLRAAVDRMLSS
jgi:PAS domain S-box-containing protein